MATEVIYTDEFGVWFESLSEAEQDRVAFSVGLLEERGVTLPHPHSSSIKGASFALRELRTQVKGTRCARCMPSIPRDRPSSSSAATRPEMTASTSACSRSQRSFGATTSKRRDRRNPTRRGP